MKKMFLLSSLLFTCFYLSGQISLTFEGQIYTQNFNSYLGTSATVPANWTIPSPFQNTDAGSSNTGGSRAYGTNGSNEYANGLLRSGSTGNLTTTVTFTNNTGNAITVLDIAYDFEQWRYANTSGFDVSATGIGASVDGLDQAGSSTGTNGTVSVTPKNITLIGLNILDGANFSISFTTTDVTGSDNGVAVDNFILTVVSAPLPVDLIDFNARIIGINSTDLTWQTASEENNSHFEVEHSTNGRDFQMLDKVIGKGTTSELQQYNYIHEEAVIGKNYYRLRQVDFDGTFEYSNVLVVEVKGEGQVQIRPTHATNTVSLSFDEAIRNEVQVQVFDLTGRQVNSFAIAAGSAQIEISVADLTEGLYFVRFALNGEMNTLKFVKQ